MPPITSSKAIAVGTPLRCSHCRAGVQITARNAATRNGTTSEWAARTPAMMTTTEAAAKSQLSTLVSLGLFGKGGF